MRKNLHGRILREEPEEQHLSTIPKSCPFTKYTIFHMLINIFFTYILLILMNIF